MSSICHILFLALSQSESQLVTFNHLEYRCIKLNPVPSNRRADPLYLLHYTCWWINGDQCHTWSVFMSLCLNSRIFPVLALPVFSSINSCVFFFSFFSLKKASLWYQLLQHSYAIGPEDDSCIWIKWEQCTPDSVTYKSVIYKNCTNLQAGSVLTCIPKCLSINCHVHVIFFLNLKINNSIVDITRGPKCPLQRHMSGRE